MMDINKTVWRIQTGTTTMADAEVVKAMASRLEAITAENTRLTDILRYTCKNVSRSSLSELGHLDRDILSELREFGL
jgi:hypothetical protein